MLTIKRDKMKIQKYSMSRLFACLLLLSSACKQETIEGTKASGNEPFKVYMLNAKAPNGVIEATEATEMKVDVAAKTINFPLPLLRGGQAGSEPFTVDVAVDNSAISGLIQSGALPANTVVLDANSFSLNTKETLSVEYDMMKGYATPKVNIEKLGQYTGKHVALGLKLTASSKYSIDESMNKVVLYFEVNKVAGPIYFPVSETANVGKLDLLTTTYEVNTTAGDVTFKIPVQRKGTADLGAFTVDAAIDNSILTGASLPANTVPLESGDYTLETKVSLSSVAGVVQGNIQPKIKISSLDKYTGKNVALGLKLTNPSQFSVDGNMDKAIVYFNANALLDEAVPPTNLLSHAAWQILKVANNENVTFTVNPNGSILAKGTSDGHQGVYQPVQVKAGRKYKIDMLVKGGGASNTWFEVYIGTTVPVQGQDYANGGNRMGLNTWNGCGIAPFEGQLSVLACSGQAAKGEFTAAADGTVYVVIRSGCNGGGNLGAAGITFSNIDFRRVQ